jgi:hypothetical protein
MLRLSLIKLQGIQMCIIPKIVNSAHELALDGRMLGLLLHKSVVTGHFANFATQ